jgi:hypothetical protein
MSFLLSPTPIESEMSKTQSPRRLYKLSDSLSRIIAIFIAGHRPAWELTLVADVFILTVERSNYGINAILARQSGSTYFSEDFTWRFEQSSTTFTASIRP